MKTATSPRSASRMFCPPSRTGRTAPGWMSRLNRLRTALARSIKREALMPPAVEPVLPPVSMAQSRSM